MNGWMWQVGGKIKIRREMCVLGRRKYEKLSLYWLTMDIGTERFLRDVKSEMII